MRKAKVGKRGCAAVTAMVEIAEASGRAPVTVAAVAAAIGVSQSHLEQLCADLRGAALIRSFKGRVGGYRLARPADEISVLDIILATEGKASGREAGACPALSPLPSPAPQAQELWERLATLQCFLLQRISLADVVYGRLSRDPVVAGLFSLLAGERSAV